MIRVSDEGRRGGAERDGGEGRKNVSTSWWCLCSSSGSTAVFVCVPVCSFLKKGQHAKCKHTFR